MIQIKVRRRRRAVKKLPPPLSWVKKDPKTLKRQSTSGTGRAGSFGTVKGVMELTLYTLLIILAGRWRRVAFDRRNALRGLKSNKETPKQQSTTCGRRVGATGGRPETQQ